ncbi:hypothetical protein GCM10007216_35060 [Thalassobacillus devorans]|uniref:Uncharacterized protein n=1 Tax=Thalassobacillus devorans TaxID=279813 RepID=A0ABQ1PQK4_9BACI|nr:hypothetical protein [Thalassobacillus devorans]NIK30304.1 hypothetical protein [Thalassobacillus devorans]GGD01327.1 hypothetical protein GCM10007216_35060 [Thalassobacillus devorans]
MEYEKLLTTLFEQSIQSVTPVKKGFSSDEKFLVNLLEESNFL